MSFFDKESQLLFKNSSWVFIANTAGTLLAFLRSVIIARGLGAETLGQYTVAVAFVLTVQEILKLNIGLGIIRYGAQYRSANRPDKIIALIKAGVIASMGSAVVSIIVVGIILLLFYDRFVSTPGLAMFIFLFAVVNGVSFLDNIGRSVLNLFYKFRVNSTVQIVMDIIEFSLIAFCIYYFKSNLHYFFGTVILARLANSLICNAAVVIEMRKELGPHIAAKRSLILDQMKDIRKYVIGNSFSNTLKTFMNQGDVLILAAWAGPAAVGLYAVAKKLGYAVLTLTDPLVKSIFPQLSILVFEKRYVELKLMIRKITLVIAAPAVAFLIVAWYFSDELLLLVYGFQFISASNTFVIHLLGALQGAVFFWTLPLINSLGLTSLRFRIYILAIICGFLIAWGTVRWAGSAGVATGLLAANVIITLLFLFYANRSIKKDIPGIMTDGSQDIRTNPLNA